MKRTPLTRRTPLASGRGLRRTPLRGRPRRRITAPEIVAFKAVVYGRCQVCDTPGLVRRHHVLLEQIVRREHGNCWDLHNSLWVGVEGITCTCHHAHHTGSRKIRLDQVPDAAVAFAVDLLGEHRAADYFQRRYEVSR